MWMERRPLVKPHQDLDHEFCVSNVGRERRARTHGLLRVRQVL